MKYYKIQRKYDDPWLTAEWCDLRSPTANLKAAKEQWMEAMRDYTRSELRFISVTPPPECVLWEIIEYRKALEKK